MSAGHARALLSLDDPHLMEELAQRIVQEGLSVRAVERLVAGAGSSRPRGPCAAAPTILTSWTSPAACPTASKPRCASTWASARAASLSSSAISRILSAWSRTWDWTFLSRTQITDLRPLTS
ncbi:hypothetical protein [Brachybacterium sp. Z12]|uniref:hypothetical protein n=1 Tax=Brachybacterium sp. Z12 TaxID=2759167 RepID=UPI00292A583E|nr:hypothetical protein [Brachybacterium sp. Z12]